MRARAERKFCSQSCGARNRGHREPVIEGDVVKIPLTKGFVAMIDLDDLALVLPYSWCVRPAPNTNYAQSRRMRPDGRVRTFEMHRLLMGALDIPGSEVEVDHINGDGLDNRRANLRICTPQQNQYNRRPDQRRRPCSSKYRGVSFAKTSKNVWRWRATITFNRKVIFLGNFDIEEEAARAYDAAAQEYYGEFARLNFPAESIAT